MSLCSKLILAFELFNKRIRMTDHIHMKYKINYLEFIIQFKTFLLLFIKILSFSVKDLFTADLRLNQLTLVW
jgi:hypothetical protein